MTLTKGKHNRAKRDTSTIRARVVYVEYFTRKGALSKANQAITSTAMPNADPTNIDLLRTKLPETAHPDRDPVRLSSRLWPRPQVLEEHWSSDAGIEFLDKYAVKVFLCCAVSPCFALPIYSLWQSKADHLQRQALSAWRLERFMGNCSAFSAERN